MFLKCINKNFILTKLNKLFNLQLNDTCIYILEVKTKYKTQYLTKIFLFYLPKCC